LPQSELKLIPFSAFTEGEDARFRYHVDATAPVVHPGWTPAAGVERTERHSAGGIGAGDRAIEAIVDVLHEAGRTAEGVGDDRREGLRRRAADGGADDVVKGEDGRLSIHLLPLNFSFFT
jgi:hypothetical protein